MEALLDRVDVACSRFREDSELSELNRAGGRWTAAGPPLLESLDAALWAAAATGGAVDPTVGRALRVAGYDRDFAAIVPSPEPVLRLEPVPGWRAVEIDLGSTAKALAADRAAAAARAASGAAGALVSLGGDIAVAGRPPGGGWPVLVSEDGTEPAEGEGEVVLISDGGMATSSTLIRRWTRAGVELHHIIDPATGAPVRGPWRAATVAAASCLEANAAATAAIVKGDGARAWLEERRLPARLVDLEGMVLALCGWPGSKEEVGG